MDSGSRGICQVRRPNTDAFGANASNATDVENSDRSCYILEAESVGQADGPNACGADASNATDAKSLDSSCCIIDAESMGQGVLSEPWAPASQVPEVGTPSLSARCDQRCDAMKEHRPGKESTPVKSCAVSLLIYGGAEPKKRDERLEESGAENADVCYELEDGALDRTDSRIIEGARSSGSSGCPN